jgi:hypothetical protein
MGLSVTYTTTLLVVEEYAVEEYAVEEYIFC